MNRAAGFDLEIPCVCVPVLWVPGLHREAQEPLAVAKNLLTALNSCSFVCLYYMQWPFNVIQGDRYYRLTLVHSVGGWCKVLYTGPATYLKGDDAFPPLVLCASLHAMGVADTVGGAYLHTMLCTSEGWLSHHPLRCMWHAPNP